MKTLYFFCHVPLLAIGLQLGTARLASAQMKPVVPEYREKLRQLDALLQQPLRNQLVTEDSYAKALARKQAAIAGLSVPRGQTLGTSATAGDKSAALNIGLTEFRVAKLFDAAIIANSRFNVDQGFVKLLSPNNAHLTMGYGGTLLLFGQARSVFTERDKKNFHYRLRELRRNESLGDKKRWADTLTPYGATTWQADYTGKMVKFILRWRAFQQWLNKYPQLAHRFYEENGNLKSYELTDMEGEHLYLDYLDAEHAVLALLPKNWDKLKQEEERYYIRQQLGMQSLTAQIRYVTLADTLQYSAPFLATLSQARDEANEAACRKHYLLYDSLQQQAPWSYRVHQWVTGSALYNAVDYPLFNAANKAGTYADTYTDRYWQTQLTYNGLLEGKIVNTSWAAGIGTSNQIPFRTSNQLTYQTTTPKVTGVDTALVVQQKLLYPTVSERVRYLNLHTQFTATLATKLPGFGFTGAYEVQLAPDRHGVHNITLGAIVPVRAGTTTLLLIPQARARGLDAPDRWSFGFTLTATMPSVLLNALK